MEYIHKHIHPWAKWNQSSKIKVQYVDLANKGNQKLYLPIKNKANLSTNWKTKLKQGAKWRIKQWKQNEQICWEKRKEIKERNNRYTKLNRGRWRFMYIKD